MKPIVHLLWLPGKNCHHETAYWFGVAGADARIILLNQVLSGKVKLSECDLLCFCGGFGWGDDIRSGIISAIDLMYRNPLVDEMEIMLERRVPMIGICNGFQELACTGLLNGNFRNPTIMLDYNQSATFEHWVNTRVVLHHHYGCIWTEGLDGYGFRAPLAHCEGVPVFLGKGEPDWHVAATYGTYEGVADYPASPNGSPIAGLSYDNIFAIMPHPERNAFEGLSIFKNGVNAVK